MTDDSQLELLGWTPPRQLIVFPLTSRVGKIRHVASKLMDRRTEKAAVHYRKQVTEAMILNFDRLGISEDDQNEQLVAFWDAVQAEMIRQTYSGRNSGGAA